MRRPLSEKIKGKYVAGTPDECWPWTASYQQQGYGQINLPYGGTTTAHRAVYEVLVGPIPKGLVLDHLCQNPACVNPAHMEPVTHKENILRGTAPSAVNARKTHCPQGHEYTDKNTHITQAGRRHCRACDRERHKRYYDARKEGMA